MRRIQARRPFYAVGLTLILALFAHAEPKPEPKIEMLTCTAYSQSPDLGEVVAHDPLKVNLSAVNEKSQAKAAATYTISKDEKDLADLDMKLKVSEVTIPQEANPKLTEKARRLVLDYTVQPKDTEIQANTIPMTASATLPKDTTEWKTNIRLGSMRAGDTNAYPMIRLHCRVDKVPLKPLATTPTTQSQIQSAPKYFTGSAVLKQTYRATR